MRSAISAAAGPTSARSLAIPDHWLPCPENTNRQRPNCSRLRAALPAALAVCSDASSSSGLIGDDRKPMRMGAAPARLRHRAVADIGLVQIFQELVVSLRPWSAAPERCVPTPAKASARATAITDRRSGLVRRRRQHGVGVGAAETERIDPAVAAAIGRNRPRLVRGDDPQPETVEVDLRIAALKMKVRRKLPVVERQAQAWPSRPHPKRAPGVQDWF